MKQTRTKRIQVRCQPCHYFQVMKAALKERDSLESQGMASEGQSKDLIVISKGIDEILAKETPESFQQRLEENGFENDFEEDEAENNQELTDLEMLELGKRASNKADLFMAATFQIREAMKLHKMNRENGAILYVINKFKL